MIATLVLLLHLTLVASNLCGDSIRWSHHVDIEHVYGVWHGVGYAQHSPDITNLQRGIGCVTLYITGADDFRHDRREWNLPRKNSYDWEPSRGNSWQETPYYTPMSNPWLDNRMRYKRLTKRYVSTNGIDRDRKENNTFGDTASVEKRRVKRDIYGERRLLVMWDEDGRSVEQTYTYSKDVPGLWTVEKWRPMEREMITTYGVDMWYPDGEPPRHPEVIRVLNVSPDQLVINHCSDSGGGGVFTLILRRSPQRVGYWEWWRLQKEFDSLTLSTISRGHDMSRISLCILSAFVTIGVESATFYPRSYSDSTYSSSTVSYLNGNSPYGSSVGYGSERYPNYSPSYGYSSSTPGYNTGYSSTRYPGANNGYSSSSYNPLYSSGMNNQGYNNYGSGSVGSGSYGAGSYGAGTYGSGSSYGSGSYGSNNLGSGSYGSSTYGSNSLGSGTYGSGTYGTGLGSSYGNGMGSNYGRGYASAYPNYGSTSTYGGSSLGGFTSSYEAPFMGNQGCINRGPQNGIHVDSLMGMWYGVEYIQHLGADSHVFDDYWHRTCIVIHIAEPIERPSTEHQPYHQQALNAKFFQQHRHLRLLWDEAGQSTEYSLFFRNDTAGYWQVFNRQNGTLAARDNYQHFGGSVQVLEAVNDRLVLNFCQEGGSARSPQLYSVLFSRYPGQMSRWEIEKIHNMLQNKKLSVSSRRMVCGNSSAEKVAYSVVLSILTCAFAYIVSSA
ncbi:hypothetical protein O0L34_g12329 [Tuta absoluta]|nr:hypothetical protein O0L34_g12329 [Tuta absoluta]